jgi:hypothetical protein
MDNFDKVNNICLLRSLTLLNTMITVDVTRFKVTKYQHFPPRGFYTFLMILRQNRDYILMQR